MTRLSPEADLQRTLIAFLRLSARHGVMWNSIPNEGRRSPQEATRLKAMGMKPGAADLLIVVDREAHWLELKAGSRPQTTEQRNFQIECEANGIAYSIARSFEEAREILNEWGALKITEQRAA